MSVLPPMRRGIAIEVLKILLLSNLSSLILIFIVYFIGKNPKNYIALNTQNLQSLLYVSTQFDNIFSSNSRYMFSKDELQKLNDSFYTLEKRNIENIKIIELKKIINNYIKYQKMTNKDYVFSREILNYLINNNYENMSKEILEKENFSTYILGLCCALFFISLFISIYYSERLSEKIATPIKKISEILKFKPDLGQKLKFPEAENVEMKTLILEFSELWNRLSDLNRFNIRNLRYKEWEINEIINFYSNGIFVLNHLNKVIYYNHILRKIIGAENYEIKGNNWYDLSISSNNYIIIRDLIRKGAFDKKETDLVFENIKKPYIIRKSEIKDQHGNLDFIIYELVQDF
ncbi:transcriptional regulator [Pigmentibacter ruber]|uniref:hypothetical protein n=1 Tax=Pigmentibacter ruber TaxID=2683196 RepID=UPI00131E1A1B|nr:hypothetical protein [Pigmentibacter ruber]